MPTEPLRCCAGNLEPDEGVKNALRREVIDETGWTVSYVLRIGL